MSAERVRTHEQRVESHLRDVNHRESVLAALDKDAAAKRRIQETFGGRPELVIVYLGVRREMKQQQIAEELAARGLRGASQPRVSLAESVLEDAGFVKRSPMGRPLVRDGWEEFGLAKALKKILKDHQVRDFG